MSASTEDLKHDRGVSTTTRPRGQVGTHVRHYSVFDLGVTSYMMGKAPDRYFSNNPLLIMGCFKDSQGKWHPINMRAILSMRSPRCHTDSVS